jgi:hypothetical protein
MLLDRNGDQIGKLQDVYVDTETDEPQFGTVKEGFMGRHLTFVPLAGLQIGPDDLQVTVTKDQVRAAPEIECTAKNCRRPTSPPSITTSR